MNFPLFNKCLSRATEIFHLGLYLVEKIVRISQKLGGSLITVCNTNLMTEEKKQCTRYTSWFLHLFSTHSKTSRIDRSEHLTHFHLFVWLLMWPPLFFSTLARAETVHWLKIICGNLIHGWILFRSAPIWAIFTNSWRHSTRFTSHWFISKEKPLREVFRNCQYKALPFIWFIHLL